MSDESAPLEPLDDVASDPRVVWSVPEVGATAVLVVVGVLAAGGLAAGISLVTVNPRLVGGTARQVAGSAIQNGAVWAGPLLALAILAVLVVAWWQASAWSDAPGDPVVGEAAAHRWRAWQLRRWAQVGLLVTSAGSMAGLVGVLISDGGAPVGFGGVVDWWNAALPAATTLATLVVSVAGIWIGARVRDLAGVVAEDEAS